MKDIDTRFQELAKKGTISRNKFIQALTGAGVGAEFAGIIFDSFDLDGNKYVSKFLPIFLGRWYQVRVTLAGLFCDTARSASAY
jgi:hypothetical protein